MGEKEGGGKEWCPSLEAFKMSLSKFHKKISPLSSRKNSCVRHWSDFFPSLRKYYSSRLMVQLFFSRWVWASVSYCTVENSNEASELAVRNFDLLMRRKTFAWVFAAPEWHNVNIFPSFFCAGLKEYQDFDANSQHLSLKGVFWGRGKMRFLSRFWKQLFISVPWSLRPTFLPFFLRICVCLRVMPINQSFKLSVNVCQEMTAFAPYIQ